MRIEPSIFLDRCAGRLRQAFTMIEIAISLGVIGFALVAIVGLLPRGLNAQRDNRQDTIVNQDGAYLLEVLRGGIRGVDDLTNYVDYIVIYSTIPSQSTTNKVVWYNPFRSTVVGDYPTLTNGQNIVSLMSMPKYTPLTNSKGQVSYIIRDVRVFMWAMGGSALESGANTNYRTVAFRYKVHPEIIPFAGYAYQMTNFITNEIALGQMSDGEKLDNLENSNRFYQNIQLTNNLYDVSLRVDWPLRPNDAVAASHNYQIFRTFVNANQIGGVFQPQQYTLVR